MSEPDRPPLAEPPATEVTDRLWTVPNALSMLRLLGVPLFLWLLLGPQADGWAIVVLAVGAFTDYLDGKLARALGQTSRIGQLLDPAADRLYILSTLLAFLVRDIVPWWVVGVLVLRDVVVGVWLLVLRRHGYEALQVNYLGKTATFCLLYAFPLILAAQGDSGFSRFVEPVGYAFLVWGSVLYLVAGAVYVVQVAGIVRDARGRPAVAG